MAPKQKATERENPMFQAKFVGPYLITACYSNHTYRVERQGWKSVQNKGRPAVQTLP